MDPAHLTRIPMDGDDRHSLLNSNRRASYCVLVLMAVFSLFAIGQLGLWMGKKDSMKILQLFSPKRKIPLPGRFKVDSSYVIPVWDQSTRGTCWCFAMTYLLESQYKAYGVAKGYLDPSEYVAFSQEGLAKVMVDLCNKYPNSSVCAHSGRGKNQTNGGRVEDIILFAEEFPQLLKSVMPVSACPYQADPDNEMNCPSDYEISLKTNPLEFKIKGMEIATGINSVKRMLFEKGRPLSFSLGMPVQRYWFECTNDLVKYDDVCKYKLYPCEKNQTKDCAPHDFVIQKGSDSEMVFHQTAETVSGTGHAMVLVGYNDDFVPKRTVDFAGQPAMKGGFIIRNSWGARGHSLEYLMGEITEDQESYICPNKDNVMMWIPATYGCVLLNENDVSKCSQDMAEVYGDEVKRGAFELICVNSTHCDMNKTYVLLRADERSRVPVVSFSETGVPVASVVEIGGGSVSIKNITSLPFQHLYYALQPKIVKKDDGQRCGHVFFSYDVMKTILSLQSASSPSLRVVDIEFDWLDKSYLKSGQKLNYTHVAASTKVYKTLKLSHPYDVLEV